MRQYDAIGIEGTSAEASDADGLSGDMALGASRKAVEGQDGFQERWGFPRSISRVLGLP